MTPILQMHGLRAGYGDADILTDLNIDVGEREIVGIIGPNGAGKSTAMKAFFGLLKIRSGAVSMQGRDLTGWAPNRIVQAGISYVPQVDNIFGEMTVQENLDVGAFLRKGDISAACDRVYNLFPDLRGKVRTIAGSLSGGQRQMVAMGRALMLDPKVLLLDEPTAGLSPKYMDQIFHICRDVRDSGVAILLVEQHAKQALAMCDRAYVLVGGRNRLEGTGAGLLADPMVATTFLGG